MQKRKILSFEIKMMYYFGCILEFVDPSSLKSGKSLNLIQKENIHDHMKEKPQCLHGIFHLLDICCSISNQVIDLEIDKLL